MNYKTDGLNELSKQFNDFVVKMGFNGNDIPLRIALIHSEVSETLEAFRDDKNCVLTEQEKRDLANITDLTLFMQAFKKHVKDTVQDELADSVIRLLDLCSFLNVDIEYHVKQKMRYNENRGFKYGGKKF